MHSGSDAAVTLGDLVLPVTAASLWTATQMVLGFVVALFLGARFLPGLDRRGYAQPDGSTKEYKLTGMTLFFVTHIAVAVMVFGFGVSLTPIVTHFWSLFAVANALAIVMTAVLHLQGRREGVLRSTAFDGVRMPPWARDLWFGNELNPTWFGVDVKMFLYQPSLIGVDLIVVAFAFVQRDLHGSLTPQMACLLGFWWAYLFTHYVKEEFMLSTWDVTSENFGFMLVWGDLVYVPFLYSLPCWWIARHTTPFETWQWLGLSVLFLGSLWVFREANWQKERYKRTPEATIWGKKPEVVGGRLLASGWWGIGRKLNYTGEIGVYLCFALASGFEQPWPYVLPLSLMVLLVQRAARDDRKCSAKYGEVWKAYCERTRFRILPFVY
jgi:delta14-sterol reductase